MPHGRRILDLALSGLGLLLLWPLLLVVAGLVWLGDGSPVLFCQERSGRYGVPFQMWKFRSMRCSPGRQITVADDPRITRLGRFLRRSKLDELPQLVNVLKGDMSLVGPRPELIRYTACYTPEQRRVLALVPGLTDPASLAFIDEERLLATAADAERTYVEQVMPEKIRLSLDYAARANVFSDVGLILATFGQVLRRRWGRTAPRMAEAGLNAPPGP